MHRLTVFLVVCCLAVPAVWAGELAEVKMADEITVGDATLRLNGMGLRKKMWVKVYVAGLYLESPAKDAVEALNTSGIKQVVMHFLTDKAKKKKMDSAWVEGFQTNSSSEYDSLKDRVKEFADLFGNMKVGDVIELTMVPGGGTTAALNGEIKGVIDGDDFATGLLRVWLGDHPPSDDLKAGMLGSS
jgi:Chalcone isomerase-like